MEDNSLNSYTANIASYHNHERVIYKLWEQKNSLRAGLTTWLLWIVYFVIFLFLALKVDGTWAFLWIYPGFIIPASLHEELKKFDNRKETEKLEQELSQAYEAKEQVKKQIEQYEQPIVEQYQYQIEDFFQTNLYKKRSGSALFEENLGEFASIIHELEVLNENLVTKHIPLHAYKHYLERRRIDHHAQVNKTSERIESIRKIVRRVSEAKVKKKELITPQNVRRPRKIDWDGIHESRKLTGRKGEEIAVIIEKEYLENIGRKDLAERVKNLADEQGDGLGYDILSYFADGRKKYIEVKSTVNNIEAPYYLSINELNFLKEHPEDYFLYRILISNEEAPTFQASDSAEILKNHNIVPVTFIVKNK